MKVLELQVTTDAHARIRGDKQNLIQKPINLAWSRKLLTINKTRAVFKNYNVVKITASNREDLYYICEGFSIGFGVKYIGSSDLKMYYCVHLGAEILEPEEN